MQSHYPATFSTLNAWAKANNIAAQETRVRFAQYGILRAVTESAELSRLLVFKGGNALDFVWQPNRSTKDLDFSSLESSLTGELLKELLERSFGVVNRTLGTLYRIHKVERQPPGADKTFVTYIVNIGYALPDEQRLRERMEKGGKSPLVIPLEVSLNEPICEDEAIDMQGSHKLRVCTLEDIVAEKLRSLLQQPIRNRHRRQDLLDIAVVLSSKQPLQRNQLADFLLQKAAARNVPVSREAFRNPEVATRARQDYDALQSTTREAFIPYEEALASLYQLIDELPIPQLSS